MNEHTLNILNLFEKNVTELDISNMQIHGVLDLDEFTKLKKLNCSNNKIIQIINIPKYLDSFDISNNLFEEFAVVRGTLSLNYKNNPLKKLIWCLNSYPKIIPNTLTHIFFDHKFNLEVENLPFNITYVRFSPMFNKHIDNLQGSDPKKHSITHIEFAIHSVFNNPIDNLPVSLEYLYLSESFNKPINNLPDKLIRLEFGYHSNFNQSLDNLPNSLEYLIFDNNYKTKFNQSLNNLPNSLEYLQLPENYNTKISCLPSKIKNIYIRNPNQKYLFEEDLHSLIVYQ